MPEPSVTYPRTGGTGQADDRVKRGLDGALPEWARGSRLIEGVAIKTTATTIPHHLSRAHRGWIVARIVGAAGAGPVELATNDAAYNPALAATHLQLVCDVSVVVSLVVF